MTRSSAVTAPLMFVSGYVYRILRLEARSAGLRWTGILVLKDLDLLGPLTQQALADIEQVSRPTMTVLLHELEELGWVTRKVHSANRSSNLVHLTARGRKELRAAGTKFLSRIQTALEGLAARDLANLERGLAALARMWMDGIRRRPRREPTGRQNTRRTGRQRSPRGRSSDR
jgi:DNA-binding MarR family transcriptional regulator